MTTRVTVNAHAGWPVEVVGFVGEPTANAAPKLDVQVVEPNTERDFHIHSGYTIASIRELDRPE